MEQGDFDWGAIERLSEDSARAAMRHSIVLHLAELDQGVHSAEDLEEAACILAVLEDPQRDDEIEMSLSLELADRITALQDARDVRAIMEAQGMSCAEAIEAVLDARHADILIAAQLWSMDD